MPLRPSSQVAPFKVCVQDCESQKMTLMNQAFQDYFLKYVKTIYSEKHAKITECLLKSVHQGMCFNSEKFSRSSFSLNLGKSSQDIAAVLQINVGDVEVKLRLLERDGFVKPIGNLSGHPVFTIELQV